MEKKLLYWTELCWFNSSEEDFGINKVIKDIGNKVDGFVFLFSNIGFYNNFNISDKEIELNIADCVYGGIKRDVNREKLRWTNFQLKGLIQALHSLNIKAYATVFDNALNYCEDDFAFNHKEILQKTFDNKENGVIDLTSKLNNKTLYVDFLSEKILQVLNYYNFDGAHLADGISSYRIPVQINDFSSERLAEFKKYVDEKASRDIDKIINIKTTTYSDYKKRSYLIWNNYKYEWIRFCCDIWAKSFNLLTKKIKSKKSVIINSAWLRDPFESIYRYAMDFSLIDFSNIDVIVFNDVNRRITSKQDDCGFHIGKEDYLYCNMDSASVMMLTKAMTNKSVYNLVPIRDTNEGWEVIKDCPHSYFSKCVRKNAVFYFNGKYQKISEGNLFCLSTNVKENEWKKIKQYEEDSLFDNYKPYGYCLYFSKDSVNNEIKDYINSRRASTFWQLKKLQSAGMQVYTVTDFNSIEKIDMPLVCINYENYSQSEKEYFEKEYKKPFIIFGKQGINRKEKIKIDFDYKYSIYLYNVDCNEATYNFSSKNNNFLKREREYAQSIWIKRLNYENISLSKLKKAVYILNSIFNFAITKNNIFVNCLKNDNENILIVDNPNLKTIKTSTKFKNKKFVTEILADGIETITIKEV